MADARTPSKGTSDTFLTSMNGNFKAQEDEGIETSLFVKVAKPTFDDVENYSRVKELHGQLSGLVTNLSEKVSEAMKNQEQEFLTAYRAHIFALQRELQMARNKVKSAEESLQRDKTITKITAERDFHRNESVRLSNVIEEMKSEQKAMKDKLLCVEEDKKWLEQQLVKAKKQMKLLVSEVQLQNDGNAIANEPRTPRLTNAPETISLVNPSSDLAQSQSRSFKNLGEIESKKNLKDDVYRNQIRQLKEQLNAEQSKLKRMQAELVMARSTQTEMQSIFSNCVEETKANIAKRKAHARRLGSKINPLQLEEEDVTIKDVNAVTFKQFTTSDKTKVIEQLLMRDDVYEILYESIFCGEIPDEEADLPEDFDNETSDQQRSPNQMGIKELLESMG